MPKANDLSRQWHTVFQFSGCLKVKLVIIMSFSPDTEGDRGVVEKKNPKPPQIYSVSRVEGCGARSKHHFAG